MRVFDIGGGDGPERVTDRILTVPNLLSFARLAILPLIYLDLVSGAHLRAFVLLVVFASTDWFDGYIARRFDQVSKLGKLLDPLSDRVLFVVVGIGFAMGELLPWWAILLLLGRDVLVVASGGIVLLRGGIRPDVTRLGKAATFGLLFALPAFLLASVLGDGPLEPQPQVHAIAWIVYWPSLAMYWLSGLGYTRRMFLPTDVLVAEKEAAEQPAGDIGD
jgi:cardiolipin synthase (CMP-forming)